MSIVEFDGQERALDGDIRLDGREIDVVVGDGLEAFDEELTVDGSPLMRLSVLDPDRTLTRSGLLDSDEDGRLEREVELVVDEVAYWLSGVRKAADTFELTFEDRTVARLRMRHGRLKVSAKTLDHVAFARRLCDEIGVELVTGEAGPIEQEAQRKTALRIRHAREEADRRRRPGMPDKAPRGLTIKGARLDAEQIRCIDVAGSEALRHDPSPLALETLFAAGIVESEWRNVQGEGADAISFGVLQNIPGTSAGVKGTFTREQALDVAYTVRSALLPPGPTSAGGLIKVAKEQPGVSHGTLADICINGVGVGDPGYVDKVDAAVPEARAIIRAFRGGDVVSSSAGSSVNGYRIPALTRGTTDRPDESSWDALRRQAGDYGYRFFVVANVPYYISDEALMRSRGRATLSERDDGEGGTTLAESIDWEWMPRRRVNRTPIDVFARDWQLPTGCVVLLDEDSGPAQGRWLIETYRRDRFSPLATIEVIRGSELLRPKIPLADFSVDVARGGTTSPFGGAGRFPISGAYGTDRGDHVHSGLDVGVPCGTPCIAPFDGEITYATTSGFGVAGGMVHLRASTDVAGTSIRKGDQIGWGHVSAVQAKVGQKVSAGTRIATSGGDPCHVHFVLLRQGGGGNGVDGNADPTADLRALGGLA